MNDKQLNEVLIAGGISALGLIIWLLFSQPVFIGVALVGLFWYFRSRASSQKLNIIQEFKNNPEKHLGSREQVRAIEQSIRGLSSRQDQQEVARDLIACLEFAIPKFEAPHLVKPGTESVLRTCFQILDPEMELDECSHRAEKLFEHYSQR